MPKRRAVITLTFTTDMDMVPGWGYNLDDWTKLATSVLMQQGHYNPSVEIHSAEARACRWDAEKGWTLDPAPEAAALATDWKLSDATQEQLAEIDRHILAGPGGIGRYSGVEGLCIRHPAPDASPPATLNARTVVINRR